MTFTANVLPLEAAYYTLVNATIVNKVMTIQAGGSASITIDKTILVSMTDHLKINLRPAVYTNSYDPETLIYLNVKTPTNSYNIAIAPVWDITGVLSAVFELEAGAYTNFTLTFTTTKTISFSVWEMCPEATADVDVTTIIDGVTQSLPKLLSDYNVTTLNITQEEDTVAIITCNLLANTDLQGHFLVDFELSEYSTVYVRFYDEDIEELFAPLQFTLNPGHNTITVPHAYLAKLAGIHSFIVTMQCTNGSITIYPRGMLFTVDGGYLAQRLIDIGIDMLDLSIYQPKADDGPAEIWAIGIDGGNVLVRSRAYTIETASAEWTPKYAYGEALDAAIEFNGNWVRPTGQQRFTIETEAEPYVAIVAKDGTLTIQKGMATPLTLDTGVTQVSMIRGYKSQNYVTQDQGLIVAYIKVNKAYYRSYAYSEALGAMYWYPAELLHADNFDFVHVHRLNDYRVGFALSSSIVNYWLTTTRTYVAQACPPESINYEVDQIWSFTAINVPANTNRTVTILEQEEPSNIFILTFPFTILSMFAYTELLDAFHITADNSNDAYVTNCNIADKLMTLTLSDALYGTVNITLPDFIGMATPYGNVAPASKVITTAIPNFIDHTYLSYTLSDITAVIVPRPITTKKYTLGLKDSITYTVSDILAAIQIKPILTEKYTLGNPDSVTYTVSDITVAMTLRNASLQPI